MTITIEARELPRPHTTRLGTITRETVTAYVCVWCAETHAPEGKRPTRLQKWTCAKCVNEPAKYRKEHQQ